MKSRSLETLIYCITLIAGLENTPFRPIQVTTGRWTGNEFTFTHNTMNLHVLLEVRRCVCKCHISCKTKEIPAWGTLTSRSIWDIFLPQNDWITTDIVLYFFRLQKFLTVKMAVILNQEFHVLKISDFTVALFCNLFFYCHYG